MIPMLRRSGLCVRSVSKLFLWLLSLRRRNIFSACGRRSDRKRFARESSVVSQAELSCTVGVSIEMKKHSKWIDITPGWRSQMATWLAEIGGELEVIVFTKSDIPALRHRQEV